MRQKLFMDWRKKAPGSLVLLAIPLVLTAVFLEGGTRSLRESTPTIRILLPLEGAFGLQPGAAVSILGTVAGSIIEVRVTEEGRLEAAARIENQFLRFIRVDSVALLKKKYLVAGDTFVEITPGRGEALSPENALIQSKRDTEVIDLTQQIITQLLIALQPVLEQVRLTVEEFTKLGVELRDPEGKFQQTLNNLYTITSDLKEGKGVLGQLLQNPEVTKHIQDILLQMRHSIAEVAIMITDVRKTTAQLPRMVDTIGKNMEDLPRLITTAQYLLEEIPATTRPIIKQAHMTIEEFTKLGAELRSPAGNFQQILRHLNTIAQSLEKGTGTIGQLLQNPEIATRLQEILVQLRNSTEEIGMILQDIQETTAHFPQLVEGISQTTQDLPGLLFQTQRTLRETEKLLEAMQRHWLLRKYAEQPAPSTRISPVEIRGE